MRVQNLQDVFELQLKDLYNAEQQLTSALPKMARAASSSKLQDAFKSHLEQTKEHVNRLEQAGKMLKLDLKGETCKAMQGLIKEGDELISDNSGSEALDAALIAAAQRVEHYEIAAYGSSCTYAKELGHHDVDRLLQQTLGEEKETDEKLTNLAESRLNEKAMQG